MIPSRAYVVVSKPDPVSALPGTDWSAITARSIHLNHHSAAAEARRLRKEVFQRLAMPGEDPENYITRQLEYRQSVKVTICRLDKIATALIS